MEYINNAQDISCFAAFHNSNGSYFFDLDFDGVHLYQWKDGELHYIRKAYDDESQQYRAQWQ